MGATLLPVLQVEKLRPRSSPLREIVRILTRLPELQSPILLVCLFRDSHLNVSPRLAQTQDPPASAYQVLELTGLQHHASSSYLWCLLILSL